MKIFEQFKNWIKNFRKAEVQESEKFEYLNALADLLYLSIRKQDEKIAHTIDRYIDQKFNDYREEHQSKPIAYPELYYQIAYKTAEEIAILKTSRFSFLESSIYGADWLIGYKGDFEIQGSTYAVHWNILLLALEYNRDDLFMQFWKSASQFAEINLITPPPIVDDDTITDQKEIEKRETQKSRYFEFIYALGGLVLYLGKYELIKKMFRFSNSHPPKYTLLPDTMNDVFEIYFQFRNPDKTTREKITTTYNFPGLDGINNEYVINEWICKFAALLFIRQYTLPVYFTYQNSLELPTPPTTQKERREWLNNLDHFLGLIEGVKTNGQLLTKTGLDQIDEEWFKKRKTSTPRQFFRDLKDSIQKAYEESYFKQPISPVKKYRFYYTSAKQLNNTLHKCEQISVQKHDLISPIETEGFNSWIVKDYWNIQDRELFLNDNNRSHGNYHSITAEVQSENIKSTIADTFNFQKIKSFLLDDKTLFPAINKIKGDQKSSDFVIINTGIYLGFQISQLNIAGLSEDNYKGIPIISFKSSSRLTGRSFYFLQKKDLPYIIFRKPESDLIKKFNLKPFGKKRFKMYASIVDLKEKENLIEEINYNASDLNKKVMTYISTRVETRWKKSVKMFELRQYTSLEERGMVNNLREIKDKF